MKVASEVKKKNVMSRERADVLIQDSRFKTLEQGEGMKNEEDGGCQKGIYFFLFVSRRKLVSQYFI